MDLKDIKESNPVQLVEYAVAANISMWPAFAWWVPHTLKKSNPIIAKVKSKYWLKTHKFGIKVPNNIKQAIEFDRENGNKLWSEAVCQETNNICPTFEHWEKLEGDIPPGYQDIKCHLIFDINMGEKFCRNSRFVVGGYMTETPTTLTYAYVVSRDSVHIALTIADLNGL